MRLFLALLLLLPLQVLAQAPAQAKAGPNAPYNAARTVLIRSLDQLAAHQTAARRAEIARIHTLAQAKARQAKVRATMLRLLGPLPERTPLNPQVLGETQLDGFRIQKILFDSQPGFHVTALLYLPPVPAGERLPAIVVAPGHGATGKASDFAFASTFARNGFAVLSYDPIGQGERLQYPDPADPAKSLATRPTGEHAEASLQPMLLGESVAKYFLWDGMRAVDYLQSRPEIDGQRIGAFGCSGGGAMTALLGALDPRIAATGTACYITSFETLLPAIGPQDGEQSTPGWIAAGLDFPDWVEAAAPRPYAIVSTASDMFPYAGARASAAEARRFYAIFNPSAAGTPTGAPEPGVPTAPTLNPDTANTVPVTAPLEFIVGPGGHGNLRPLQGEIVRFFLRHLAYSNAEPKLTPPAPGSNPFALPAGLPAGALQVTSTGQVATAYPGSATVFSLNLAHFRRLPPPHPLQPPQLKAVIRQLSGLTGHVDPAMVLAMPFGQAFLQNEVQSSIPTSSGRHGATLFLGNTPANIHVADQATFRLHLLPYPPGSEDVKTPLLGMFYLLNLRAELTGHTLIGLRMDQLFAEVNRIAANSSVDPENITAEASGHEALVLLHAAVLDPRLKHITLTDLPRSYREVLTEPLPKDIAEDILPGVLLHYDIPDLIRALGDRVTVLGPDNPQPAK